MMTDIEWGRYAVVHWTVNQLSASGEVRGCSQTRAFAGLAEAVQFATGLDRAHRQTARIDCGGTTYHASGIEWLAARSDFLQLHEVADA
ncbi:hypothetical protein [Methylobacterium nigriterrae]|uniref:hypothetical protein n=1 Tax=Methylobacterium nigriterrae TaxID=3127512 RepID=UPI00301400AA